MEEKMDNVEFMKLLEEAEIATKDKSRTVKESFVADDQKKIIESFSKKDEEYTKQVVIEVFKMQPVAAIPVFNPVQRIFYSSVLGMFISSGKKKNRWERIYTKACKYQQLLEREISYRNDVLDERLEYLKSLDLMLWCLKEYFVELI